MTDVASLLTVQELDNNVTALRHRLATLPERAALNAAQALVGDLEQQLAEQDAPRHALELRQRKLEDEATTLRAKADSEDKRLYSGAVSAVRELQAIQEEISSLRRRSAQLDEQILELMMEIEPLTESIAGLRERHAAAEADAARQTIALAEVEAALVGELRQLQGQRTAAAAEVPPEALAHYERLRPSLNPSTVVRLVGSRCEGCPSQMPSVEVDRIRHLAGELAECDECGRLVLH